MCIKSVFQSPHGIANNISQVIVDCSPTYSSFHAGSAGYGSTYGYFICIISFSAARSVARRTAAEAEIAKNLSEVMVACLPTLFPAGYDRSTPVPLGMVSLMAISSV